MTSLTVNTSSHGTTEMWMDEGAPLLGTTGESSSQQQGNTATSSTTTPTAPPVKLESSSPSRGRASSFLLAGILSSRTFFPSAWDVRDVVDLQATTQQQQQQQERYFRQSRVGIPTTMRIQEYRTWRRRLFLVLTEPDTSLCSALFFGCLVVAIMVMNVLMMLQTLNAFQFTPKDCLLCGGSTSYLFEDDSMVTFEAMSWKNHDADSGTTTTTTMSSQYEPPDSVECVCAPTPYLWTDQILQYLVYGFSVEWILRVLCFAPAPHERATTAIGQVQQFIHYLFSWPIVLDFWATFPYYMEFFGSHFNTKGFMSFRLLRLFRVFQLVRMGSYSVTFTSLMTVLSAAVEHLKILGLLLLFGGALFGSLIFWLEKGEWQYWEATQSWEFVRINEHGQPEISPFTSIPETFYWFMVTATTVGYGDIYPTSNAGRWVGVMAMLLSLLVIAFPVSVFSDLWSKELEKSGAIKSLEALSDQEGGSNLGDSEHNNNNGDGGPEGGGGGDTSTPRTAARLSGSAAAVLEEGNRMDHGGRGGDTNTTGGGGAGDDMHALLAANHVEGSVTRNWNYGYQHAPNVMNTTDQLDPSNIVILQKTDLAELLRHVQNVTHSQTQIKAILRKYKIVHK
eukprot:CAMPEP_0172454750 /NCGR_PEP_ID=MMETSP1065-20121228/11645_1 /TAXON_ID=265537 /ORGANISM="Amphiprora paludosa, Strain CCMP125" /LENGTH=620 /DNA_ID=CAMNT_0013207131 /DNA_START=25 /DNA_END=1890 /DNA_ORIENTATION=-